jgi:hypothetical protein
MDIILGQGGGGRRESPTGSKIMRFPAALRTKILRFGSALGTLRFGAALGSKIMRFGAALGTKILRVGASLAVPRRPWTVDAEPVGA